MSATTRPGVTATLAFVVEEADTAAALGSGSLPVLGTPRLVAWLEAASCAAMAPALETGTTTVGTRVTVAHEAPSPVGATVQASATLARVDPRSLTFTVTATSGDVVIGRGEITRAVVDEARFMGRLER